jgi:hypothetical protein
LSRGGGGSVSVDAVSRAIANAGGGGLESPTYTQLENAAMSTLNKPTGSTTSYTYHPNNGYAMTMKPAPIEYDPVGSIYTVKEAGAPPPPPSTRIGGGPGGGRGIYDVNLYSAQDLKSGARFTNC